jgi:activator of HSP90 ATPase
VGIAATLGGLAAGSRVWAQAMQEKPADPAHATLTALHYEIDFKARVGQIYSALLESKQFAAFSGLPAEIDAREGGAFKMFAGQIEGRNIELVPNLRIVQAWRPASWDKGIYSLAHFELKSRGGESTLTFDHTSFPVGDYDHLDWGWKSHYWEPLKKYFSA